MRRHLLNLSPLALFLALTFPAHAEVKIGKDQTEKSQTEKNHADKAGRDFSRGERQHEHASRDGNTRRERDGDKAQARDNAGNGSNRGERQRDTASVRERNDDVTGSTRDKRERNDRSNNRDNTRRDRDDRKSNWGSRDNDRRIGDRDGRGRHGWGHWDWKERNRTKAVQREWHERTYVNVNVSASSSEIAVLQELIEENEADIAQATRQYWLTSNRQTRIYLQQLIASREAQIERLQDRIDALS